MQSMLDSEWEGYPLTSDISYHTGPEPCVDKNESCHDWFLKGECLINPDYMLENCRKSCKVCGKFDMDQSFFFICNKRSG